MMIITSQQAEEIAFVPLRKIIVECMDQVSTEENGNEEYMMGNIGAVTT